MPGKRGRRRVPPVGRARRDRAARPRPRQLQRRVAAAGQRDGPGADPVESTTTWRPNGPGRCPPRPVRAGQPTRREPAARRAGPSSSRVWADSRW